MTRRAPLFGLLAAALIAVLFYFLLWSPRSDELEALRQATAALEGERGSLENEVARLREVEDNEPRIRAALARLEEYIPTGIAQSTAVRQFQLAADAAGVEIANVLFAAPTPVLEAPTTGTPETVLATVPVTMSVEGGYFQAVDFFRRLEVETPRAVLLNNLSLVESDDTFPALTTTWTGNLFAIVPATTPPEAAGVPEGADGVEGVDGDAPTQTEAPVEGATTTEVPTP